MNKLVTVLGVAAVATLAGCKDPNYKHMNSADDVKNAAPKEFCQCPIGTIHSQPCACGLGDCQCVVEAPKPAEPAPVVEPTPEPVVEPTPAPAPAPAPAPVVKPAEPETTTYIVQNGDYLAKISKKFNLTIDSIKRVNNMTSDTIRVGQKIKLPGKVNVGEQKAPVTKISAEKAKKGYESYKGATKEYVVKSGDTIGAIAYGNGCNIRQLKEMNNLKSDVVKVGQKLKIPANGKAAAPAPKKAETKKVETAPQPPVEAPVEPTVEAPAEAPADPVEAPVVEAPAAPETVSYTVQEGDDMTGVSIRFCVSAAAIRELNNLPEDAQLTPGQTIKLPADAQQ